MRPALPKTAAIIGPRTRWTLPPTGVSGEKEFSEKVDFVTICRFIRSEPPGKGAMAARELGGLCHQQAFPGKKSFRRRWTLSSFVVSSGRNHRGRAQSTAKELGGLCHQQAFPGKKEFWRRWTLSPFTVLSGRNHRGRLRSTARKLGGLCHQQVSPGKKSFRRRWTLSLFPCLVRPALSETAAIIGPRTRWTLSPFLFCRR